jgi:hypothetical protein
MFVPQYTRLPNLVNADSKRQVYLLDAPWNAQGIGAEFPAPGGGGELERIARCPIPQG